MKPWSRKQSSGAIRGILLLGGVIALTLGVIFAPLLRSHNVKSSDDPESQPHSHGVSQALASTSPSTDALDAPLLSVEQQTELLARYQATLRAIPGVMGIGIEGGNTLVVDAFVHTDKDGVKPAVLPDALRAIPPFLDAVPVKV